MLLARLRGTRSYMYLARPLRQTTLTTPNLLPIPSISTPTSSNNVAPEPALTHEPTDIPPPREKSEPHRISPLPSSSR